jgi:hypothetical protein
MGVSEGGCEKVTATGLGERQQQTHPAWAPSVPGCLLHTHRCDLRAKPRPYNPSRCHCYLLRVGDEVCWALEVGNIGYGDGPLEGRRPEVDGFWTSRVVYERLEP